MRILYENSIIKRISRTKYELFLYNRCGIHFFGNVIKNVCAKKKIWILTIPSPMLLTTHGTKAVDPVCDVTIVLFSVAKWTGGLSKGGNEAANSFISSAVSESVSENQSTNKLLKIFWFISYKTFSFIRSFYQSFIRS